RVAAPREGGGDGEARDHRYQRAIGVEAIQPCGRRVAILVHGADPEAALGIGAPIVEAVMRGIVWRACDLAPELAVAVREPQAVAQRRDESTVRPQRETTNRLRPRPRGVLAGKRV